MQEKKSLLKEPLVIMGLILIIIVFIFLLVISSKPSSSTENEEESRFLSLNNSELLYDNIDSHIYEAFLSSSRVFFSQVYPEISSLTIKDVSYDDGSISFSATTNDDKVFTFSSDEGLLIIKNSLGNEIYSFAVSNVSSVRLSPHLIENYFPYKDVLSNNNDFEAKVQKNNKDIEITIHSCVSKDMEKEAIEKTKKYISDLNSDPSFFDYSTVTFCF